MMRERDIKERVVITGMGAFTPLGLSVEETWAGLVAGRSGIAEITQFDASHLPIRIAGEIKGFDVRDYIDFKEARRMARCSHLAVAAGQQAMADAGLGDQVPDPERAGVVMGTGIGGFEVALQGWELYKDKGMRRINPFLATASLCNMPAHHLSLDFQCQAFNTTVVTACAAGTQGIGEAA
ncbi:MAG: beta-ketoacyl-[acyl-carrier-protein] synthase family protein, partial [Promethearchaeota archaeon]